MRFRPCIDIHNGRVKQIVGGTLSDRGDLASENFVSEKDAAWYARFYRADGLKGGHVILLNPVSSSYYGATRDMALSALRACPGDLMIGGGMNAENASFWIREGASHVIVTSYVFSDGRLDWKHLREMIRTVGREHLVLDLSCRKKDHSYYIVTDRWQKFTDVRLDREVLDMLMESCSEFLIHAVDAEGKRKGPETELVELLAEASGGENPFPITYAGGVGSFEDLEKVRSFGRGRIDVTIGSALDLFGGDMPYRQVLSACGQ